MKSVICIAVCLVAFSGIASAQAAVEGALTHGLSGAASATAGKALGQIGNQLAGRLGQQTSNAVRPAVTTVRPRAQKAVKVPQAATTASPAANGGSLIASIQGGEQQQGKACGNAKASPEQAAHPSEIMLPAPK